MWFNYLLVQFKQIGHQAKVNFLELTTNKISELNIFVIDEIT